MSEKTLTLGGFNFEVREGVVEKTSQVVFDSWVTTLNTQTRRTCDVIQAF